MVKDGFVNLDALAKLLGAELAFAHRVLIELESPRTDPVVAMREIDRVEVQRGRDIAGDSVDRLKDMIRGNAHELLYADVADYCFVAVDVILDDAEFADRGMAAQASLGSR